MNAYDEMYLGDAVRNLGEAFDHAVQKCGMSADEFMTHFIISGISKQFGKGNPKYVCGMSGTELAIRVLEEVGINSINREAIISYDCSPEYWSGWAVAYYQWRTGRTFKDVHRSISMESIMNMYPTFHEMDEEKFVEALNQIIRLKEYPARLQRVRKECGYSQRQLSEKSGVNLRTLQQYELKTKDINKAAVGTVVALSKAIGCELEDILEYKGLE